MELLGESSKRKGRLGNAHQTGGTGKVPPHDRNSGTVGFVSASLDRKKTSWINLQLKRYKNLEQCTKGTVDTVRRHFTVESQNIRAELETLSTEKVKA